MKAGEKAGLINGLTSFFNLRRLTSLFTKKTLDPIFYFFFYFKWDSKSKVELFFYIL